MSTVNVDELAHEVTRMNRAIVRCLHYLAEEIPESRRGDYLVLLNDVHNKHARLAHALGIETETCASDRPVMQSFPKRIHSEH